MKYLSRCCARGDVPHLVLGFRRSGASAVTDLCSRARLACVETIVMENAASRHSPRATAFGAVACSFCILKQFHERFSLR